MSPRLRALVADDEPLARARLRRLLELDGGVDVIAECADGEEAIAALQVERPDVAFLDIHMPNLNGFQVLEGVDRAKTRVVFVTAYAEHAVRAFEANAVDYLLKPLSVTRLQESLQRVRSAVDPPEYARRLAVPVAGRMHLLPVEEIDVVTAQANYVRLQAGEREFLLRESLGGLMGRLDPGQFVHVHRSRIVRIEAVRDIETLESGQYLLRLHNGMRIPTGRSYRVRLREVLGLR